MLLKDNTSRRIFLAIPAPQEVNGYLEVLKINNHILSKIKWMRPYNIHLTIYFIGSIPSEDFEKATGILKRILSSQKEFELEFEKICLSPENKPRMIWARYYRNDQFTILVNNIHNALVKVISNNKFFYNNPIPHITLARFNQLENLTGFKMEKNLDSHKIIISKCELWESVRANGKSDYKSIQSFSFQ